MNLVQQLAEYQNAPIQTLEAAKQGANPAISPWVAGAILSDRLEKQKRMQMAQSAAQGPQPTVSEQQDQQVAGIMGLQGAPQGAPQAQPAPQAPAPQQGPGMASGGIISSKMDPRMFDFSGGGIIAFDDGGKTDKKKTQEEKDREAVAELWEGIKSINRKAGAAIADVATLPLRGVAGAYDAAVVRPMRAAGIDAGYLSRHLVPEGVDPSSMTPFYDRYARSQEPQGAPSAADAKKAEFERLRTEVMDNKGEGAPPKTILTPEQRDALVSSENAIRAQQKGAGAQRPAPSPAAKPAGGIATLDAVQKALTESDEWKDLDRARRAEYAAPNLPETAGAVAGEKAAHLKAQGVEKAPWEIASEQTAAIQKMMESQEAERQAARKSDSGWLRMIANMGPGSFGQSGAQGLRALQKHEDEMAAEDQRVRERQLDLRMKLDAINAKAKELQYNEATGDVTKAQENRKELARLKRDAEKDRLAIAGKQAELRERAAAAGLQAQTQLQTAGMQAARAQTLTPKQLADIRDKAADNVRTDLEKDPRKRLRVEKIPGERERLIQAETDRMLAAIGAGGTMPAPSATGAGGKPTGKWGQAQVVK